MFQHGRGHRFDIIRRNEVPSGDCGERTTGQEQRLRSARARAHQHTLVLARRANDVHEIRDQLLPNHEVT